MKSTAIVKYKPKYLSYGEKKEVKKIVKKAFKDMPEMKQYYAPQPVGIISNTGGTKYLLPQGFKQGGVSVGTTDDTRIGDKIKVYGFTACATFSLPIGNNSDSLRAMLIVDKQANGVSPIMSELLLDVGTGRAINSPIRESLKSEYNVLYDKTFVLKKEISGSADLVKVLQIKKKYKTPITVSYYPNQNTGNVVDIQKNSIYLVLFTGVGAASVTDVSTSISYTDA